MDDLFNQENLYNDYKMESYKQESLFLKPKKDFTPTQGSYKQ